LLAAFFGRAAALRFVAHVCQCSHSQTSSKPFSLTQRHYKRLDTNTQEISVHFLDFAVDRKSGWVYNAYVT
jgi:hypothetical protein